MGLGDETGGGEEASLVKQAISRGPLVVFGRFMNP